jgi:hypothetical protein
MSRCVVKCACLFESAKFCVVCRMPLSLSLGSCAYISVGRSFLTCIQSWISFICAHWPVICLKIFFLLIILLLLLTPKPPSSVYVLQTLLTLFLVLQTLQSLILAFMMGTHTRLGFRSPVLNLDSYISVFIAQAAMADAW